MDLKDKDIQSPHVEHAAMNNVKTEYGDPQFTSEDAKVGENAEKRLTILGAIKAYPMAIFWSFLVSMCVIMEGYDTILISNFYAYPTFARKYGEYNAEAGTDQLTAAWQAGLGNAAGVGSFFGVLMNGYLVDAFGQKRVLLGSLVSLSAFLFIVFFAPNIGTLTAGEFLCGLPWGVFASSAPAYASEVLPLSLRVYFTSYTNMCFVIGQFIAAGVLAGLVGNDTQWGYRIPFAIQWVWPVFIFPLLLFAPESPWHLVRKNRLEEAENSLKRLVKKSAHIDTKETLAIIVHTNKLEVELAVGTSYWDCFKGFELRRTEIACIAFAGQVLAGSSFANGATYFFQQVGFGTEQTYHLNLGAEGLALGGTLVSWFLVMPYLGRRPIYIGGMAIMTVLLFIIGILNVHFVKHPYALGQAALCLVWVFAFQVTVAQLGWALPAEIGSTRLRQKTICVARNTYYVVAVVSNVLEPYFMNPEQWDLKGYTGFVWGGTAFLVTIWAYFRLPEIKGRPFSEVDVLFAKGVSARKFKDYQVDTFDADQNAELAGSAKDARRHSAS